MEPEREARHDGPGVRLSDPVLRERWSDLRDNGDRALHLAGDLDPAALWRRPEPERWSVGECLDHLVLAGNAYLEGMDAGLEDASKSPADGSAPELNLFERVLVRSVQPPVRFRIPAPRRIRPRRPDAIDATRLAPDESDPRDRFRDLRTRYSERLVAADGHDLRKIRVHSPFVPLIHVSLHAALLIVVGHERRHLAQATNALAGR